METTKTLPKLKKCPKCGANGELKITSGGFDYYYAIHCTECECNSRGMGNILPMLYSTSCSDSPQISELDAINKWNSLSRDNMPIKIKQLTTLV